MTFVFFLIRVSILRQQLDNYKKIIELRVCDRNPVITYQDNMQVKRTSLRHLRLSKLQRSKLKQGKMWDFTVRGWRASDISGIEEMFDHVDETTKPQRDLSELDYVDTKIGELFSLQFTLKTLVFFNISNFIKLYCVNFMSKINNFQYEMY